MIVENEYWKIRDFVDLEQRIDPRPPFQRGPVWKKKAKQLLVDTIYCGFDIPKIFLQQINGNGVYDFSVTDGQQRLLAIWGFIADDFPIGNSPFTKKTTNEGLFFSELIQNDQDRFLDYEIVVAKIVDSRRDEIRELFWRLQQGSPLNAAEKRNCMPSVLGDDIRSMAQNHAVFKHESCAFKPARHQSDEICAYAFALQINGPNEDIKAPNLKAMYETHKKGVSQTVRSSVNSNLTFMKQMYDAYPKCIRTKWGFVDIYLLVSKHKKKIGTPKQLTEKYTQFEARRKEFNANAEELVLKGRVSAKNRRLYDYIKAFNFGGSTAKNISKRQSVMVAEFVKEK